MTRVRRLAIRSFFAIALVSAFVFPATSALSTRELRIENFQSETIVMPDGTIDVTETIQAHFIGGEPACLYPKNSARHGSPPGVRVSLLLPAKRPVAYSGPLRSAVPKPPRPVRQALAVLT